jgi:hypothetical protein
MKSASDYKIYIDEYIYLRKQNDAVKSLEILKNKGAGMFDCLWLLMKIEGMSMTDARYIIEFKLEWDWAKKRDIT